MKKMAYDLFTQWETDRRHFNNMKRRFAYFIFAAFGLGVVLGALIF